MVDKILQYRLSDLLEAIPENAVVVLYSPDDIEKVAFIKKDGVSVELLKNIFSASLKALNLPLELS